MCMCMCYNTLLCVCVCVCVCVSVCVCRKELISKEIEETVARMQVVIELGRYLRDRKVIPIKVGMASDSIKLPLSMLMHCGYSFR